MGFVPSIGMISQDYKPLATVVLASMEWNKFRKLEGQVL
jgi:hypothetical protein